MPSSAKRLSPAAATTVAMSPPIALSEIVSTSQSDRPLPRWSKRTRRHILPSLANSGCQIGLRHSYSRWFIQFGALSTGAPSPMLAQAICTPSGAVANCTRCCVASTGSGRLRRRVRRPLPHADRPGDVLHPLAAHVAEGQPDTVRDGLVHDVGDADAAGLGEPLQPRGDVHPVAKNVAVVEDDVAEVDPEPVGDAPILRGDRLAVRHRGLDFDRAADRILGRGEFRQHPVAGGLDDPPAAARDLRIEQFRAVDLLARQHTQLVPLHETAVARHVGSQDRGKTAFHVFVSASKPVEATPYHIRAALRRRPALP